MYKTINGFTKAKMIDVLCKEYKGQALHIYEDGSKSTVCSYLNTAGQKCAVGCFIPDGHEGQKIEYGVSSLLFKYRDLRSKMPLIEEGLRLFQIYHDHQARSLAEIIGWVIDNVED